MALAQREQILDDTGRLSEATAGDFLSLLKPRVMSLVIFTAFVGQILAPGSLNPILAFIATLCIAVGAGAAGALNMWYDADIDAVMSRTQKRPVPDGRVTAKEALAFGLTLSAFSVATLGLMANWLAGGLLAFTIFFYAVIYTMWLKRSTPQNIVIGGAAGALPPVVGWAATSGAVSLESIVLFLIIFLWTPPHFWALALFKTGDYERAGVPMMPNVAGEASTKRQIFIYSILVAVSGILPTALGFASIYYGAFAAALGLGFIWYAWRVLVVADETMKPAKSLFGFSVLYLFAIFAALLVEAIVTRIGA
ncbi:protoheme IX farnesyltransferase [Nitratireductor aestuarii]|uniref:Protoheme IX farnesyltransferase n=1 Tax=Nitratireductor aestuarii TaxID=1735103 RepID=A0A916RVG1_9HYPH|nr:heme o synthase [Nitratireductor aestuarii]GGA72633.1 protoheme IX farnesyltransferase [Nitratireductor aestuarii]